MTMLKIGARQPRTDRMGALMARAPEAADEILRRLPNLVTCINETDMLQVSYTALRAGGIARAALDSDRLTSAQNFLRRITEEGRGCMICCDEKIGAMWTIIGHSQTANNNATDEQSLPFIHSRRLDTTTVFSPH